MNLKFESNFVVMPADCNYMYPMVFGGEFFARMDLCAASCVGRLLQDSKTCDSAVTYMFEGRFHAAAQCGDLIFMEAEVIDLKGKHVNLVVEAYGEKRAKKGRVHLATSKFVFVTKKGDQFCPHGLTMPELTVQQMEKLVENSKCPEKFNCEDL